MICLNFGRLVIVRPVYGSMPAGCQLLVCADNQLVTIFRVSQVRTIMRIECPFLEKGD